MKTPMLCSWIQAMQAPTSGIGEREVVEALRAVDPVWDELFPAEQFRILQILVNTVAVAADGLEIRLPAEGLNTLTEELRDRQAEEERTAA